MPVEACSGLWRSEDMVVVSLQMQREVAHDAILKLGEIGMFQFHDLNEGVSAFQRDFVQEVRHCDEMERKIRFLREQIEKAGIMVLPCDDAAGESMLTLEHKVDELYAEVVEFQKQSQGLLEEYNRTREHLEVMKYDFGGPAAGESPKVLTGVLPKDKLSTFERMVYWVSRGNSILRTEEIEGPFHDTATNEPLVKVVFAVYFSALRLRARLVKLCEANQATLYPASDSDAVREGLLRQLDVVAATLQHASGRQRRLLMGAANSCLAWHRAVLTERAIFARMNCLKFTGSTAVARGWAPRRALEDIRTALIEADLLSGAQVSTVLERVETTVRPPTYFRTNAFTSAFQGIVDSYGTARYKEANPGVLTIVTFPYLFGIMFGDIGHGLLLTVAAAYLVWYERSFQRRAMNEIFAMIFGGRYLLLAMGLFAVYMGLLYNEMFGFALELFGSGYRWPEMREPGTPGRAEGIIYPVEPNGQPNIRPASSIAFGVDSAWEGSESKLEVYNSIKMKCSVIVGVVQMLAGVAISYLNYRYFNQPLKVWYRFIPEVVFLTCTFGYMCLLIVIKWLTPWPMPSEAPSLLETMTDFFLSPGTVRLPLFTGQAVVQVILLLVAAACVPCLLCLEPYMAKKEHDRKRAYQAVQRSFTDEIEIEEGEFQLTEVIIHQIIHTIEYVLGCVSNTASYLRLWALSLAHSQLSEVFWNFAFLLALEYDGGSGLVVFFGFAVWMAATLGVLLGMESLSAFLHALRLHWVEFNNKFYAGDGYPFEPFDLTEVLSTVC